MERTTIGPRIPVDDRDQTVVLHGISWSQYDALDRTRGPNVVQPRMAFLDGALEVMTTGSRHELDKKLITRLLECYAEEREISLIGLGNTTFRKRAMRAGLEPDECYCVGTVGKVPELALEIVQTSGGIDKLEICRRLDVAEVWFWIDHRFSIYRRHGEGYQRRTRSVALRGIDLDEIARIVGSCVDDRQTEIVRTYRRSLQAR